MYGIKLSILINPNPVSHKILLLKIFFLFSALSHVSLIALNLEWNLIYGGIFSAHILFLLHFKTFTLKNIVVQEASILFKLF
jgi:hypothetical protein